MSTSRPPVTNPQTSRAVLIGTSHYSDPSYHTSQLPSVANNIHWLGRLLRDPEVWGLAPEHCVEVLNPESSSDVVDPIEKAAADTNGTLLVYYAGHGFIPQTAPKLYLTHTHSANRRAASAVDYELIRDVIVHSAAQRRVVIIDCCYAGNAAPLMGGSDDLVVIERAFLLTATQRFKPARAPEGQVFTAFTNELVHLLRNGLPEAGEHLTLNMIYKTLRTRMAANSLPEPGCVDLNNLGGLPLFGNWAHPLDEQVPSQPGPKQDRPPRSNGARPSRRWSRTLTRLPRGLLDPRVAWLVTALGIGGFGTLLLFSLGLSLLPSALVGIVATVVCFLGYLVTMRRH
jgi:hypothetical protein